MHIHAFKDFSEVLSQRRCDAPQVIVAGWFLATGEPVGGACVACDETPTEGETLVAHAAALAACIKRINDVFADDPKKLKASWKLVEMIVGDLSNARWIKNDLASPRALAGAAPAATLFDQ